MAKIEGVIKSEIVRLSRRDLRTAFLPLKREVRRVAAKMSGISQTFASLNKVAKALRLGEEEPKLEASPEEVKASRLTAKRIGALRKKLGISQREMGILTGSTLGAVQMWEKGKFRPKPDKKAVLVALRKLGKRDVRKLLTQKAAEPGNQGKPKAAEKPKSKRTRRALPRKTAAQGDRLARKARPRKLAVLGQKIARKTKPTQMLKKAA